MKRYQFVVRTHHYVSAESLREAIGAFEEMKRTGRLPTAWIVERIEVQDEHGDFVPIDRPLRAGDLESKEEVELRRSA